MNVLFWVSYGVMWIVLAATVVLVILLYRQFGLMIMPGGRRISYGGLDVGMRAPVLTLRTDDNNEIAYDWTGDVRSGAPQMQGTLALFAMPGCPLCESLSHNAELAALPSRYPNIRFMWIEAARPRDHHLSPGWTIGVSPHGNAHQAMDVPGTPFAYIVSPDSRIVAKSLVNEPADMAMMISDVDSLSRNLLPQV